MLASPGSTRRRSPVPSARSRDSDSQAWIAALRAGGAAEREAVARLHALLLRAARFEVARRRASLSFVRGEVLDDVALQAADDALVAVLAKLDDFRGASRFTTWAYKFALLEAGVRVRRRAWQDREVVLEPEGWAPSPIARAARGAGRDGRAARRRPGRQSRTN